MIREITMLAPGSWLLAGVTWTLLTSGCSRTGNPEPGRLEPELATIVGRTLDGIETVAASTQEHDFGPILTDGQTLRHEFTIENPTDRPMRLIGGTARTPCCSSFESLPESIPPKGEAKVPVLFKPGNQSGPRRVEFVVKTDDERKPRFTLALRARLATTWEIESLPGSSLTLPIGKSGQQRFRIIARRKGDQARGLPEKVSAPEPLVVAFEGSATDKTDTDGLIVETRVVVVTTPASNRPGSHRDEIVFGWPDGHSEAHLVTWEFRPRLKASPSGFVLHASARLDPSSRRSLCSPMEDHSRFKASPALY